VVICIARGNGGLGNQLFQYAALRDAIGPNGSLWLLRFDALRESCEGLRARFVRGGPNISRGYTVGLRLAAASGSRCVTIVDDDVEQLPVIRQGARLAIVPEMYFQNGDHVAVLPLQGLRPRSAHLQSARTAMADAGGASAFVHVRLRDYRTWGPGGQPAALGSDWLTSRVEELLSGQTPPRLIGVTDDPRGAAEMLRHLPIRFDARPAAVDLAIMASCESGVLSPSTLSWWGARFAKASGAPGPFLAPTYWAGHRIGAWYPPTIWTSFLDYRG
jgi:hypothetical protein